MIPAAAGLAFGSAVVALTAAAQEAPKPAIDCHLRHADCEREIASVEQAIRGDPQLADLRRRIDRRLALLRTRIGKDAGRALAQDEMRHRRSLRRDLFTAADHAALDDASKQDLRRRLEARLAWLHRVTTGRGFAGRWANASGEIIVREIAPGRFTVSANLVELEFLKWTCELEGEGVARRGSLIASLGDSERLELRLERGALHSAHIVRGASTWCGASGHANGLWFRTDPSTNERGNDR